MKNSGMKNTLLIALLSLLFTLGLGFAQESGGATGGAMMSETGGAMMEGTMMMDMMNNLTFAEVDTDGNGAVDEAEFDAAMGMMGMMGEGMMMSETGGAMMGETGGIMDATGGAMMGDMMMGMSFSDFDTDGNGTLDEEEFNAMRTQMMDMMGGGMTGGS